MNKTRLVIARGTKVIKDAHHIIDEVVIPNSVKSIGYEAFYGMDFTSIVIPDSVTSIGNWAFQNCYNLKSVRIPNGVKIIGFGTFCGCESLEEVIIPNSVTHIGFDAFDYCDSLKAIYVDREKGPLNLSDVRLQPWLPKDCKIYWRGEF